jgi:5'-nucleotidase (lipoprotein e(P4) family)
MQVEARRLHAPDCRLLVTLLSLVAGACASHHSSLAVHWVRDSAEYRAAAFETFAVATKAVDAATKPQDGGRWGVIVDADETILNTSEYEQQREREGLAFSEESFAEWVRQRRAPAVPGAPEFLGHVRAAGGVVAIVTNRQQSLCADTEANLQAVGLVYDVVLCRPEGGAGDKTARFRAVEDGSATPNLGPVRVVAWLGDNIQDFPSLTQGMRNAPAAQFVDFSTRYFVLPNPMYGSWVSNPEH